MKRKIQITYFFLLLLASKRLLAEENFTPLPGNGVTAEWCDVASSEDLDEEGKTATETLRERIELYNEDDPPQCSFLIYFLFRHEKILLQKPLFLKNHLHDRNENPDLEFLTGTYVSGYGPGGTSDRLDIILDAQKITEDPTQCAVMIEGGFSAKHQIHGFTILVQNPHQGICDENGKNLIDSTSPNCDGDRLGKECDFHDVTILAVEKTPVPSFNLLPITQWELNAVAKERLRHWLENYFSLPEEKPTTPPHKPPSIPPSPPMTEPPVLFPPMIKPSPEPDQHLPTGGNVSAGGCSLMIKS